MNDLEKQEVSCDAFEDGLRHILSHEPVDAAGRPAPSEGAATPFPQARPAAPKPAPRELGQPAEMSEREEKALFWFKLLRLFAAIALPVVMAAYVYRVFF